MAVFTAVKSVPAATKPKIAAIVMFGDPYYQSGKSWDAAGNAIGTFSGVAPRLGAGSAFPAYANVIQDYCAPSDLVCGSGLSIVGHLSYGSKAATAATFIEGKLSGATAAAATAAVAAAVTTPATVPAGTSAASASTAQKASTGFGFSSLLAALFGVSTMKLGSLFG
ncbi:MAG: cutinase family protein [Frankia sp.]